MSQWAAVVWHLNLDLDSPRSGRLFSPLRRTVGATNRLRSVAVICLGCHRPISLLAPPTRLRGPSDECVAGTGDGSSPTIVDSYQILADERFHSGLDNDTSTRVVQVGVDALQLRVRSR